MTLSADAQQRALSQAAGFLPSTALRYDPAALAFVVAALGDLRRTIAEPVPVVFTLPRAGWVSFGADGEPPFACACELVGARLAHAVLSLPVGSGIVLGGKPSAARKALRWFASFAEGKGFAGRSLGQAVRCIEVSRTKGTARFNPRLDSPVVLAR